MEPEMVGTDMGARHGEGAHDDDGHHHQRGPVGTAAQWRAFGGACLVGAVVATAAFLSTPHDTRSWGVQLIEHVQSDGDAKDALAGFSWLGEQEVMLGVVVVVLFGVDFRFGVGLALFLCLAVAVVLVFKDAAHQPRPGWVAPGSVDDDARCEGEYGFPSGHAADAVFLFGALAASAVGRQTRPTLRRAGAAAALWVAVFVLVGLSRVARGVHFPDQVVVGWLCGGAVLAASQLAFLQSTAVWGWVRTGWTWRTAAKASVACAGSLLAVHWTVHAINSAYWHAPHRWLANRASVSCSTTLLEPQYAALASSMEVGGVVAVLPFAAYFGEVVQPTLYPKHLGKAVLRVAVALALSLGAFVGVSEAVSRSQPVGVQLVCRYFLRGVLVVAVGVVGALWACGRMGLVVATKRDGGASQSNRAV